MQTKGKKMKKKEKVKSKQSAVREGRGKNPTIWFKSTKKLVKQMATFKTASNETHSCRDYVYHRSYQEQKG